ncbi:bifunctional aminotransferase class I/II-fold pyridoxal phosphate-dependent enzyme/GNAT family N-acetyltransferase [Leeuwenhoekiella parthenopeia]|uniref:Bifunctional aminotransferase class I/II-fold pyridoxal phosphate-dependent enzyme/GNAT family N-acetyltransferase n=1 Tax=Leeuwenhoekiella parthenopeia TaxID=2890320 RepID=A0ABS8GP46_9FLAO|nr:bifunctional aminotransferase class I/II-fold pyridoxal phosphate-dependent enzyme/GNAT family N-acetyltransferase [Leeuwenhoekiella parthenopeia]MCC4211288.1 bifunctional aminotransferase class I/II-fold pyridoxal phosphate-dependent enzyme/GNAT family N-acetyltransferase [Leeuwenhoekiella parthenopeia]
MAKIKHNNFLDSVDDVMVRAKEEGVLHLYASGSTLSGRYMEIDGTKHYHFGTTGYLGLEQDPRLKEAAIQAIRDCGTQFPLSKSYISHPLYEELEQQMAAIYNTPVIITKNSTLGHLAVLPAAVRDEDAVILDHQVHWSVHHATEVLKSRGIPVEMIRHNNLNMLEEKLRELGQRAEKVWYLADGVYSMYGDFAPIDELMGLVKKYPQLHLYFDDVHGMSWKGKHGSGYVMSVLKELPKQVLLIGTLSKTFGASGATVVTTDRKLYSRIKNFGGPLTFSAQLEPASVAAAIASSKIHLSDEIYERQQDLQNRISHFNRLLSQTDLPLIDHNDSPVHFIGTGTPATGYELVKLMMQDGFYTNLGIFPAVPVKNTGVRITISTHNELEDITGLVDALSINYKLALEHTQTSLQRVRRAFKLPEAKASDTLDASKYSGRFQVSLESSITKIDKELWNTYMGGKSIYDWEGLRLLEESFSGNEKQENNWEFRYVVILHNQEPVLMTYLTCALWKDDIFSKKEVSAYLEKERKRNPYHLTSRVLSLGSLITEGDHLYIDFDHTDWLEALNVFFRVLEDLEREFQAEMIVLRDFRKDNPLHKHFNLQGFVRMDMPESARFEQFDWESSADFISSLSKKSRAHFRKDIATFQEHVDVQIRPSLNRVELRRCYKLYKKVKKANLGLNTFTYPFQLFQNMNAHSAYEFIVLCNDDDDKYRLILGVMFCYKSGKTYVPNLIGLDYEYVNEYGVYRQLLYHTILRAKELGMKRIDFGMTAGFEKRKLGAEVIENVSYVQVRDNYKLESLGVLQGATDKLS